MKIIDFYTELEKIYPRENACPWDNDGLMCCADGEREVKKVLVSLDADMGALKYAAENGFDTLLCHHPMIFNPISHLTYNSPVEERVIFAIQNGISVISLHTRLDRGVDGVNETLAKKLELSDIRYFEDEESAEFGRMGETELSDPEIFAQRIKSATGAEKITAYLCRPVKTVAVIGGSGSGDWEWLKNAGADTLVTGECKYNHGLDAKDAGVNIFAAGHYFTEFPVTGTLKKLAEKIAGAAAQVYTKKPEMTY